MLSLAPHPSAQEPFIELKSPERPLIFMRRAGTSLLVAFEHETLRGSETSFELWDWSEGRLLMVSLVKRNCYGQLAFPVYPVIR